MAKEKGGFDLDSIGTVTKKILQKKVAPPKEPEPEKETRTAEPVATPKAEKPKPTKKEKPAAVKQPVKEEDKLVKTSYLLKQGQMENLKRISYWSREDIAKVLRQIVDHGIEAVRNKRSDYLKEIPSQKRDLL